METILIILFTIIFLWLIVHLMRIEDIEDKIGERYNSLEGD